MAGHSKWANIKHRKARQDAVRGRAWSKCSRAIIVAARNGGDPEMNLTLRYAIDEAKSANMPKDTITKAIKKGSGELGEGERYEEMRYEGHGPAGVAVIVECLTDNVNRTAPILRKIFDRSGGSLGKTNSVAFGFTQKGVILIEASKIDEEAIMELAIEAGAEDVQDVDGAWEITCQPTDFLTVRAAITDAGIEVDSAEVSMIPLNTVVCDASTAAKVMRVVDTLEDEDDVQKVYTNAEISDEIMAELA